MLHLEKVKTYIREALECSVFISPQEPGLTFDEIREVGMRLGFQSGEMDDAMRLESLHSMGRGSKLVGPSEQTKTNWIFHLPEEPEYRDYDAFDFVISEFNELTRSQGAARAQIERSVLVERACNQGIDRNGIEVLSPFNCCPAS